MGNKQARPAENGYEAIPVQCSPIQLPETDAIYNRGRVKKKAGNLEGAIADFTEAIKLNPDHSEAYRQRAEVYAELEYLHNAISDYDQAIKIDPTCFRSLRHRAKIHTQLGDHQQAYLDCQKANELNPDYTDAYVGLGLAQYNSGNFGAAIHSFRIALEKKADPIEVNYALGISKINEGDFKGGIEHLESTIQFLDAENAKPPHLQPPSGDTVIHLLVRREAIEVLQKLFQHPTRLLSLLGQPNTQGYDPLMLAVLQRNARLVHFLLKQPTINLLKHPVTGTTALQLAINLNQADIVKMLLQKGAPLPAVLPAMGKIHNYLEEVQRKSQPVSDFRLQQNIYKNLVFQGGSIKGIAYPSALETATQVQPGQLAPLVDLAKIERVGGASAGAINALLIGLGFSVKEMKHIIGADIFDATDLPVIKFTDLLDGEFGEKILDLKNRDLRKEILTEENIKLIKSIMAIDGAGKAIARYFDGSIGKVKAIAGQWKAELLPLYQQLDQNLGLCPGLILRNLFNKLINRQIKMQTGQQLDNVTFAELAAYPYFKDMYFVGVNLQTGGQVIFSEEHTPNAVIADAVRISMSIPGVFIPHPKVTKMKSGQLQNSLERYADGGILWNYPIELFDFARYTHDQHLPDQQAQVNHETLGFRLVSPELKTRYEGKASAFQPPKGSQDATLWETIKSLATSMYEKQESDHERKGDGFRTIYIDIMDVGMLDFERVEEEVVKTALLSKGREGVLDFMQRSSKYAAYQVELPPLLASMIQKYTIPGRHYLEKGRRRSSFTLNPHCPELILYFYSHSDTALQDYLHRYLELSVWARDEIGNTAFHLAAEKGELGALKKLLAVEPKGVKDPNREGLIPLVLAQRAGKQLVVDYLTSLG